MATTNSQLVTNLQNIYNEKLLIKQAIPTTSDNFMDYHTYISALHSSGTSYISENGLADVSSYQYAYVTVEGGGSSEERANPIEDYISAADLIEGAEGDYAQFPISYGCSLHAETDSSDDSSYIGENSYITFTSDVVLSDNETHAYISVRANLGEYVYSNQGTDFCNDIENILNDTSVPGLAEIAVSNMNPMLTNVTLTETAAYTYTAVGDLYLAICPPELPYPATAGCADYWYALTEDGDGLDLSCATILPNTIKVISIRNAETQDEPYEEYAIIHVRPYDDQNDTFDDSTDYIDGGVEAQGNVSTMNFYCPTVEIDTSGESGPVSVVVTMETYSYQAGEEEGEPGEYVANEDEDILFGPFELPAESITVNILYEGNWDTGVLTNSSGRVIYE